MAQFDIRVPLLLDERLRGLVQEIADAQTHGGFNQAVRLLLDEALQARQERVDRDWLFRVRMGEVPEAEIDWKDLDRLARGLELGTDERLWLYSKIEWMRSRVMTSAVRP